MKDDEEKKEREKLELEEKHKKEQQEAEERKRIQRIKLKQEIEEQIDDVRKWAKVSVDSFSCQLKFDTPLVDHGDVYDVKTLKELVAECCRERTTEEDRMKQSSVSTYITEDWHRARPGIIEIPKKHVTTCTVWITTKKDTQKKKKDDEQQQHNNS